MARVALVTGGSRGIGAAIARRLAADGAAVALTYAGSRAKAEEVAAAIASAGGRAKAIQADSADPDAVRRAVEETARAFGRLDILVNNAGVAAIAPIDEFKMEDFDRLVAVNVRAVFVAAQAAVRHMKAGGRIITIGSVNAEHISYAGGSVYAMTKAAVAGLSRGLARDLGPRGITVNTVQPGPIDTDMNPDEGAFADEMKKLTSLGRYGTADEVAALVAHLASPEAGYITGASITIDGGYTG
jgi:3-oxoacyl-[acyl-carrier protein] reductase